MAFEQYKGSRSTDSAPEVYINKAGSLVVSAGLTQEHLGEKDQRVGLFYDAATKRIGIKPAVKTDKHTRAVIIPKGGKRAVISGSGALRSWGVNVNGEEFKDGRYPAEWDDKEKMIVAKIK